MGRGLDCGIFGRVGVSIPGVGPDGRDVVRTRQGLTRVWAGSWLEVSGGTSPTAT